MRSKIFISNSLNPYRNLSIEEYLLYHVADNEVILYLWQNEKTVVIGRNQDIYAEVNLDELANIGGHPARRLSGGGAVYHDVGNLNFTFIANRKNYDVARQTKVILEAVCMLGFNAEKNGRNDLTIGGRKFSGHSYYHYKDRMFHNGTILIRTDADIMNKVLSPAKEKLESKGVKSVKSRVLNLSELQPSLTPDIMSNAISNAFQQEYGKAVHLDITDITGVTPFASPSWIYNHRPDYQHTLIHKLETATITLHYNIHDNDISDYAIFTDAL